MAAPASPRAPIAQREEPKDRLQLIRGDLPANAQNMAARERERPALNPRGGGLLDDLDRDERDALFPPLWCP
ncbi:MAG: hypothetical protein GY944_07230 [bacterium]|nr:hypothetical protein [bacterium]